MINRKGLSDIVTTALIILLAIVAVVIIWGFVKPLLSEGTKQETVTCLKADVKVLSCGKTDGKVTVENGLGGVKIDDMKIVLYDSLSLTHLSDQAGGAAPKCTPLNPSEKKICSPALDLESVDWDGDGDLGAGDPDDPIDSAAVIPIIGTTECSVTPKVECS